jgi:hypothetical protein
MDVFHVGASAPKAPESKNVDRDAAQKVSARLEPAGENPDGFASSPDAAAVARYVEKLSSLSDVRESVIKGIGTLLGSGMLDPPEAAKRAAQGLLDT